MFRADAARGNHLCQDRVDMQFAPKEISRFMSKPEEQDCEKVRQVQQEDNDRAQLLEATDEGGGVVRCGLCGVQANKKVNLRRRGDVREPPHQDL